jgi:hypothetical protein
MILGVLPPDESEKRGMALGTTTGICSGLSSIPVPVMPMLLVSLLLILLLLALSTLVLTNAPPALTLVSLPAAVLAALDNDDDAAVFKDSSVLPVRQAMHLSCPANAIAPQLPHSSDE